MERQFCCVDMKNAVGMKIVSYSSDGVLTLNKAGTKYPISHCPFCGRFQGSRAHGKDKFTKYLFITIGLGFIATALNGLIRDYCLTLSSAIHAGLIHNCLVYSAPIGYFGSAVVLLIGIFLLFFDKVTSWFIKNEESPKQRA